jgi:hypothetical protein
MRLRYLSEDGRLASRISSAKQSSIKRKRFEGDERGVTELTKTVLIGIESLQLVSPLYLACSKSGVNLLETNKGLPIWNRSCDRWDNQKGYTKENVSVVAHVFNTQMPPSRELLLQCMKSTFKSFDNCLLPIDSIRRGILLNKKKTIGDFGVTKTEYGEELYRVMNREHCIRAYISSKLSGASQSDFKRHSAEGLRTTLEEIKNGNVTVDHVLGLLGRCQLTGHPLGLCFDADGLMHVTKGQGPSLERVQNGVHIHSPDNTVVILECFNAPDRSRQRNSDGNLLPGMTPSTWLRVLLWQWEENPFTHHRDLKEFLTDRNRHLLLSRLKSKEANDYLF